ncbi:MAG: CDP-diacylglycerol--glycerol-3-phosphate 3-phosphatidyltransferase [Clostridia bacterium]|nr:CDP-diacylglycerol--glycerol-3-phosphate 3-phosphatidyltransferase [Clostridia bacterium]
MEEDTKEKDETEDDEKTLSADAEKRSVMNLPNRLTVFRMILIPVFIVLFFVDFPGHFFVSLAVFVAACVTDIMDGKIARKRHLITNLGKFLDPIADKVLVATAFILFLARAELFFTTYLGSWVMIVAGIGVALILARELIVSGFRLVAAGSGVVIAADMIGKYKTTFQDVTIVVFLACAGFSEFFEWCALKIINYVGLGIFAVAIVLTLISGINYIVKNRKVLTT